MPFNCPNCDSILRITRIEGSNKYFILCEKCKLAHIVEVEVNDRTIAYYRFLDDYTKGAVRKIDELEEFLVVNGFIRSLDEIREIVKSNGLSLNDIPRPIREILLSRKDYVAMYKFFDERAGEFGGLVDELKVHPGLKEALKRRGIRRLYKFQEIAVKKILDGKDVVIVAPTGNGKTEAFTIPIFHKIAIEKGEKFYPLRYPSKKAIKALFIYPTKTLSRDQLLKLKEMGSYVGISVEVFDGDTGPRERRRIYLNPPDVLITNFDILHYHLSHRTELYPHLTGVRYVVIDELHEYTGAFGSNVYFILKRLERLSGRFQIIGSSATIANPKDFAEALFDRPVEVIECRNGKRGKMHFIMIYPSLRSHHSMIAEIVSRLVKNGFKTLIFSNSHSEAEVIKQILDRMGVMCYVHRAGLRKEIRRKAEIEFRTRKLKSISATSTLELGIDIGDLDAVITLPIGLARFLQRSGRAGRRGQECVGILALRSNDPISSYYRRNPEKYFTYLEPLYVEPKNPIVARYQLIAASLDKPLEAGEFKEFKEVIKELVGEGILLEKNGRYLPYRSRARRVLRAYNIRGIGETIRIYHKGRRIGERELPMAIRELFPNAVYLHGGAKYQSKLLKIYKSGTGISEVEKLPVDYPYKTDALRYAEPEIVEVLGQRTVYGVQALYCRLRIKEVVEGYLLKNIYTGQLEGRSFLSEPVSYSFETLGFVFKAPIPRKSVNKYKAEKVEALAGSFHALEHVLIECGNIYTGGGASEMGGISMGASGVIFVYDACPGGSGASLLLYRCLDDAFKRSLSIMEECDCRRVDGCPRCTYSYQCGNNNRPLFKPGAEESIRRAILGEKTKVIEEEYEMEKPYI